MLQKPTVKWFDLYSSSLNQGKNRVNSEHIQQKGTQARFQSAEQQSILCVPESQSWQNGCQLAAFIRCQTASTKNNTSSYGFWYRGRTLIKSGQRPLDRNPSWLLLASKRGKLRVVCVESLVNLMLISTQTHPISIPLNNQKTILIIRFVFYNQNGNTIQKIQIFLGFQYQVYRQFLGYLRT